MMSTPEQERLDHLDALEREMKQKPSNGVPEGAMPWPEFARMVEDAWETSVNGPRKRRKQILLISGLAILGAGVSFGLAMLMLWVFP